MGGAQSKDTASEEISEESSDTTEVKRRFWGHPYPFTAYGYKNVPEEKNVIIRSYGSICEEDGNLDETDVFIKDGKIHAIGRRLILSELLGPSSV